MIGRMCSFAGLAALFLCAAGGIGRAQETTCSGYEYPPPPHPSVQVTGIGPQQTDVYASHPVALMYIADGGGDIDPASVIYTVTAPDGSTTNRQPDRYGGASFTPPAPGAYSVTTSWRQPRCTGSGAPSTWDITTPPTSFVAAEGRAPTVHTHTSRRPRSRRFQRLFPGDATFQVEVLCPGSTASRPGAIRTDVYYRLGSAKPTHASKHLSRTFAGGCLTPSGLGGRKRLQRHGYVIGLGALTQITATAPTRLRTLVEVSERGSQIAASYATFAPARTGESVRAG